jgi:hypothetical protein
MVKLMPHRTAARLFFARALLVACFASPGLASEFILQANEDFPGVTLASDTRIHLSHQACSAYLQPRWGPEMPFRQSEVVFLLLRLDDTSQRLFSIASLNDLYALCKHDVYY